MKYTFEDIITGMKNAYESTAGHSVNKGSDEEKQLEALASELFSLSSYGDYIYKQAFVETATGEHLDRHGALRNCRRKAGAKATGTLCFSVSAPLEESIIINENTVCSVKNQPLIQFVTTQSAVLEAGETEVMVSAEAVKQGGEFNVAENEVTVMVNAPVSIERVTNPEPFNGGYDGEPDSLYRKRIIESFKMPTYFQSRREIENRLINENESIIDCRILPCDSAGRAVVVVHTYDHVIDPPFYQSVMRGLGICELFGAILAIYNAKTISVNLNVLIKKNSESDTQKLSEIVNEVIESYFGELRIGESIYVSDIEKELYSIEGIERALVSCDNLVNDCIYCDIDSYIDLNDVQVNIYE